MPDQPKFSTRRVRFTGLIWNQSPACRAQAVRRVCESLERTYGLPRHGNLDDPLDEVVYIILSNRTAMEVAQQCFARVKARFRSWDSVLRSPPRELRKILAPAGLSLVKSRHIRAALTKIKKDFGKCDLSGLHGKRTETVESYLVSLPGISTKVARCVLMYSLRAEVLAVDAHLHRIASRLGWVNRKRADQCHQELDALVPAKRRYALHVDCIAHGRTVCRPQNPKCDQCCLTAHCNYAMLRNSPK
jgi:endonuclease-3